MKNSNRISTRTLVQLGLLAAITLVMAYTPLGYFRTPLLSVSFLTVPVAIGAMLLGPGGGALLGLIFGLTSFADAFTGGGMKAILLTLNPGACFITTVVARVLCGLGCGLIFAWLSKLCKGKKLPYILAALSCPLLNTVFFMGFIMLFYWGSDFIQQKCADLGVMNPFTLILAMVGVQGLIELIVCGILASVIAMAVSRFLKRKA